MTDDFRRRRRRKTEHSIAVFDCMTQRVIGTVSDLSESGMMVVLSGAGVCPDGLYQCELRFPPALSVDGPIAVGAHELWCETSAIDGVTVAGFRFIDMHRDDRQRLQAWVDEPGSRYA